MPRNQLIEFRKGTVTDWLAVDPILNGGEPGYESNTGRMKIGDGINHWSVLPYRDQTISMVDNGDDSVNVTTDGTAETTTAGSLLIEATDTILATTASELAAEALLARNASNLASGTVADARLPTRLAHASVAATVDNGDGSITMTLAV